MSEHPKPLAVFALSFKSFAEVIGFDSVAPIIDLVFVSNKQELFDAMRNPACFTVFVDRAFNESSLELTAGELKKRGLPWTLLVDKMNASDQDFLARIGVDEVLTNPVNATLLASRCRLMLNRFLEVKDFPITVSLPPEINLRDLRAQRKRRDAVDPRRVVTVTPTVTPTITPTAPPTVTPTAAPIPTPAAAPIPAPASAPKPKAQPKADPKNDARNYVGPLKQIESPPVHPAQLIEIVRARVQEIHQDKTWDKDLWPSQSLPKENSREEVVEAGFRQINDEISQLFKDCCFSLGAERITLLSVRPDFVDTEQVFAEHLLAIASSEERIAEHPSIPSILFPQVQVAFEKKAAVILNEAMPDRVNTHLRPDIWKLGGRIEEASAVVPLLSANNTVYAVLLIQFGTACDPETIQYLEQAATFLGLPKIHYRHIDFLGRIYRGMG